MKSTVKLTIPISQHMPVAKVQALIDRVDDWAVCEVIGGNLFVRFKYCDLGDVSYELSEVLE